MILAVENDRNFRLSGVIHRLFERFVKVEALGPFAFDMNIGNIRHDVRGVGTALKLGAASGFDAEDTAQFAGEFPLPAFTFVSGK